MCNLSSAAAIPIPPYQRIRIGGGSRVSMRLVFSCNRARSITSSTWGAAVVASYGSGRPPCGARYRESTTEVTPDRRMHPTPSERPGRSPEPGHRRDRLAAQAGAAHSRTPRRSGETRARQWLCGPFGGPPPRAQRPRLLRTQWAAPTKQLVPQIAARSSASLPALSSSLLEGRQSRTAPPLDDRAAQSGFILGIRGDTRCSRPRAGSQAEHYQPNHTRG